MMKIQYKNSLLGSRLLQQFFLCKLTLFSSLSSFSSLCPSCFGLVTKHFSSGIVSLLFVDEFHQHSLIFKNVTFHLEKKIVIKCYLKQLIILLLNINRDTDVCQSFWNLCISLTFFGEHAYVSSTKPRK